jgi:hypothetical protein
MTRKFIVEYTTECTLEIDDEVLDRVDDEWRSHLYNLDTDEDVVEHLAHNIVANSRRLSDLDGWADLPDSMVRVRDSGTYLYFVEEIS